jgi:hypothetical protein
MARAYPETYPETYLLLLKIKGPNSRKIHGTRTMKRKAYPKQRTLRTFKERP